MWSDEAELTDYGESALNEQLDCEFCGRSIMGRNRDSLLSNECESCMDDFKRLYAADKLIVVADG